MKKNKNASVMSENLFWAILLIIVLLSLITIIPRIIPTKTIDDSECALALKTIEIDNSILQPPYRELIEKKCPARNVKLSQKNIHEASGLIEGCWAKGGKGEYDFLSFTSEKSGICIYCGSIVADGAVPSFKSQFYNDLRDKDSYSDLTHTTEGFININEDMLYKENYIPEELSDGQKLDVFYFMYKPAIYSCDFSSDNSDCIGKAEQEILKQISFMGPKANLIAKSMAESGTSLTGVFVATLPQDKMSNEIYLQKGSEEFTIDCTNLVVPDLQN